MTTCTKEHQKTAIVHFDHISDQLLSFECLILPLSLNRSKVPQVGVSNVRYCLVEVRSTPSERRLIIEGRTTYGDEIHALLE